MHIPNSENTYSVNSYSNIKFAKNKGLEGKFLKMLGRGKESQEGEVGKEGGKRLLTSVE